MEESKNRIVVISLAIIVIIVVASLGYYLVYQKNSGITAMEGREVADEIAIDWNENAILINVRAINMCDDGTSESWVYYYSPTLNIVGNTNCLSVWVFSNSSTRLRYDAEPGDGRPINNWDIDSDEAYEIALSNYEVNLFMLKNPKFDTFQLGHSPSGNFIWYLGWSDNGFLDNPSSIYVQIDATTGQVLSVE